MPTPWQLLRLGAAEFDADDLWHRVGVFDQEEVAAQITSSFLFGVTAPDPTTISYNWLAAPVSFRADLPINDVTVTQPNAAASGVWNPSIATYGDQPANIQLDGRGPGDPKALVFHLLINYIDYRMRCPSLTVKLLQPALSDVDRQTLLSIQIGDRIFIANTPPTWPAGTTTLFIEGRQRTVSATADDLTFNTSPVIGALPGFSGPWFTPGSAAGVWVGF